MVQRPLSATCFNMNSPAFVPECTYVFANWIKTTKKIQMQIEHVMTFLSSTKQSNQYLQGGGDKKNM
jgi:hypothetical protein